MTPARAASIPYRRLHLRNRHLFASDLVSLVLASLLAFLVRFEQLQWLSANSWLIAAYIGIAVPLRLGLFHALGLYRRLWRHASVGELRTLVLAGFAGGVICAVVGIFLLPSFGITSSRVPISVVFMDAMLACGLVALPRLLARAGRWGHPQRRSEDHAKRTLIAGAGTSGKQVAKELCRNSRLGMMPVGFVDDDRAKHGHMLYDLPVLGSLADIRKLVPMHDIAEIVIAMPSASGTVVRQVVRAALDTGISTLTVPSLPEIISQKGGGASLREVEIQDLLRRELVETDMASVAALATGETVLITGAGGSIGSELCRQLGRLAPTRLIVLGHGENSIFDVYHELRESFPHVEIVPVIADVRDRDRMLKVLALHRPHAVFHAAAHKHVPLMEDNVVEAVTNNVTGTRNTVDAALAAGVSRFVFISTDKAVRPTSVMGASKRIAEQIVQHAATKHDQNFVSVRFGNVLGSRGSVVPSFMRQIRAGGPVTVTHPEMQRFFMTIPEAVQLVLQAGALGRGGEVFVLDMGEPVKVVDLATDLIRLSGLEPGQDIKIQFTGIRPGEKLYEEMFFSAENVIPTDHPKVLRARNGLLAEGTMRKIEALAKGAVAGREDDELRALLRELVPDFQPHDPPTRRDAAATDREFIASIA
ncbi:MAG TPA: nucleoside-diphosphate sugar epimerase/dehydratase [Gemmatimonadaceae bacterium]|nr:nucleoside-diphosphate sugar epimerase/dehydratase [Gemmatimonadaceae bacterium]